MKLKQLFLWLTLFSIAMGYLETTVVVYLRAIYYPNGFDFPLVNMNLSIVGTELGREAATLIMLVGIGVVGGKNPIQRFAWFLYCFAIWDIFYYVFLKLLLNWPESLFTWDILFLIPLPWVGPVICPCLVSLSMILLAFFIIYFNEKNQAITINLREWIMFLSGSMIVILSFIIDCYQYIQSYPTLSPATGAEAVMQAVPHYIPIHFYWWLFCLGEACILIAISLFYFRAKSVISATK